MFPPFCSPSPALTPNSIPSTLRTSESWLAWCVLEYWCFCVMISCGFGTVLTLLNYVQCSVNWSLQLANAHSRTQCSIYWRRLHYRWTPHQRHRVSTTFRQRAAAYWLLFSRPIGICKPVRINHYYFVTQVLILIPTFPPPIIGLVSASYIRKLRLQRRGLHTRWNNTSEPYHCWKWFQHGPLSHPSVSIPNQVRISYEQAMVRCALTLTPTIYKDTHSPWPPDSGKQQGSENISYDLLTDPWSLDTSTDAIIQVQTVSNMPSVHVSHDWSTLR